MASYTATSSFKKRMFHVTTKSSVADVWDGSEREVTSGAGPSEQVSWIVPVLDKSKVLCNIN